MSPLAEWYAQEVSKQLAAGTEAEEVRVDMWEVVYFSL